MKRLIDVCAALLLALSPIQGVLAECCVGETRGCPEQVQRKMPQTITPAGHCAGSALPTIADACCDENASASEADALHPEPSVRPSAPSASLAALLRPADTPLLARPSTTSARAHSPTILRL